MYQAAVALLFGSFTGGGALVKQRSLQIHPRHLKRGAVKIITDVGLAWLGLFSLSLCLLSPVLGPLARLSFSSLAVAGAFEAMFQLFAVCLVLDATLPLFLFFSFRFFSFLFSLFPFLVVSRGEPSYCGVASASLCSCR